MSVKVDALFAGDDPEGPTPAPPRILRLKKLLAIAIVLDILGLPCWTSVPGAIMTLWGLTPTWRTLKPVPTPRLRLQSFSSCGAMPRWHWSSA